MAEPLLIAKNATTTCELLPALANRHGLITGATGTGKTVTLQTLAENFSRIGVPVFMADVKGDLTGITQDETILVLMPGNVSRREILFIKDRNPEREHWTGHLLSREDARERTGRSGWGGVTHEAQCHACSTQRLEFIQVAGMRRGQHLPAAFGAAWAGDQQGPLQADLPPASLSNV